MKFLIAICLVAIMFVIMQLNEKMAKLRIRKAELEDILSISPEITITQQMIVDKLREDAQILADGDIRRMVKSYVTKIYANSDEIIITGGVTMGNCGRRI